MSGWMSRWEVVGMKQGWGRGHKLNTSRTVHESTFDRALQLCIYALDGCELHRFVSLQIYLETHQVTLLLRFLLLLSMSSATITDEESLLLPHLKIAYEEWLAAQKELLLENWRLSHGCMQPCRSQCTRTHVHDHIEIIIVRFRTPSKLYDRCQSIALTESTSARNNRDF